MFLPMRETSFQALPPLYILVISRRSASGHPGRPVLHSSTYFSFPSSRSRRCRGSGGSTTDEFIASETDRRFRGTVRNEDEEQPRAQGCGISLRIHAVRTTRTPEQRIVLSDGEGDGSWRRGKILVPSHTPFQVLQRRTEPGRTGWREREDAWG